MLVSLLQSSLDSSSPLLGITVLLARLKTSNSGGHKLVPRRQRKVKKSSVLGHSPAVFCCDEASSEVLTDLLVGPDAVDEPDDCWPPLLDFLTGLFEFVPGNDPWP